MPGIITSFASQRDKGAALRRRILSVAFLLFLSGILGLAFAALSRFALLMLALARPEVDARATVADMLASMLGNIPLIGNALSALSGNLGLAQWLEPNLGAAALVIGFLIGLLTLWSRSCKVSMHLFLPLDRSIALPLVPPAKALEPLRPMLLDDPDGRPMSWVEPCEGARKDVWQGLVDFAVGAGGKFEYQLLLGGPGTGKTRMSIEFARRVLAKKGDADDAVLVLHGLENKDMLMTRAQRFRSWWRIRVLGRDPRPDDIWHVGWFSPEALSRSSGRLMIKGQLANNLELWRPIRPTFLLLDDPLHEDSVFVVETLNKNAASFRHRVRLLIANQTVPGDLRFSRAHLDKTWQSQVHPPFASPLILSADAQLSDSDIRLLAGQLPVKLAQPILTDVGLRDFRAVTRGNPLLVELGLAWLGSAKPLLQMTEESLLEYRTRRFLQAIKTAGFDAGHGQLVDLLTMATIANGAPTTLSAGSDGETVWTVFGVQRIDQQNAERLFPAESDVDLKSYLPPMRPETIATAFARMALTDLPAADRNRIIRTAWRANPRGTLRTLLRIDGGYKFRPDQSDPLQSGFAAVPMESGLAPIEVFRLLAQASCSASPQDWEEGRYHLGAALLENAIVAGRELTGDDLPRAFSYVVDLILADRSTRILRETNAARLLVEVLHALDRAGKLFDTKVLDDLELWATSPRYVGDKTLEGWEFGNVATYKAIVKDGTTARLLRCARAVSGLETQILLYHMMRYCTDAEEGLSDAALLRDVAAFMSQAKAAVLARSPTAWQDLRLLFSLLRPRGASQPLLILAMIEGLVGALAVGNDDARSSIVPIAEEASALAIGLKDSEEAQRSLVKVWRYVVYATMADPVLCRQMADRVEAIAQRFPDHETMQKDRAEAWRHVAYATMADPALCRQMADRVEAIAQRFPDHETMQKDRADAWRHVAYATMADPALCHQMAGRVEAIAQRFPDNEKMQKDRAEAWRYVAYATRADPALCRQMADRIEEIAQRFPDNEKMQKDRAEAWRYVAYATRADPALCRQMADRVEAIARRFPKNNSIQDEARLAANYPPPDRK